MNGRLVVLGAGGFIGSHLVPALLEAGASVHAVDLTLAKLECKHPRLTREVADVSGEHWLRQTVARGDIVVSLSALCTPAAYCNDPLRVIERNYTDLVPVVRHCARSRVRLIHLSTCEVYGKASLDAEAKPMDKMQEDATGCFLGPIAAERWTYACAKQLLERVIWAHGQQEDLDFTIVRPFNVIGPRMDFLPGIDGEGVPRVLAAFMNALLRGQDLLLVDGGMQRRSFISVQEFVTALVRVVERPAATRGQILNLGNPANDVTIARLASLMASTFSERHPEAPRPAIRSASAQEVYGLGYDDVAERVPDISKACELLDWEPSETLMSMLPGIIDDYVKRYGPALWHAERAARA